MAVVESTCILSNQSRWVSFSSVVFYVIGNIQSILIGEESTVCMLGMHLCSGNLSWLGLNAIYSVYREVVETWSQLVLFFCLFIFRRLSLKHWAESVTESVTVDKSTLSDRISEFKLNVLSFLWVRKSFASNTWPFLTGGIFGGKFRFGIVWPPRFAFHQVITLVDCPEVCMSMLSGVLHDLE